MKKRVLTLALAAMTAAATLVGCGNSANGGKNIASYTGGTVPVGIYVYGQLNAINQYSYYLGTEGLLDLKFGEDTIRDAVNDMAKENVERFAAIESEFARLKLELGQQEADSVINEISAAWAQDSEEFERLGITKSTAHAIALSNLKTRAVYEAYYGEGGENAVTDEDIKAYYNDTYRRVMMIQIPKYGEAGMLEGEELAKVEAQIQDYYTRAQGGEELFSLLKEYATTVGQTLPEDANEYDYHALISREDSGFPTLFVETVFGPEIEKNVPKIYDNEDFVIIYEVRDLDNSEEFFTTNRENILYEMKNVEFTDKIHEVAHNINLTFDEAVAAEYTPDRIIDLSTVEEPATSQPSQAVESSVAVESSQAVESSVATEPSAAPEASVPAESSEAAK